MVKKEHPTSADIEITPTEDGLHLAGSILWLDSHHMGDLSFLSSSRLKNRFSGPQFLATEETISILRLNKRKLRALVCQYNRPISLGKLQIELLPAGECLGSAMLHIKLPDRQILYAPYLQSQTLDIVRKMQLKRADILILRANISDPGYFPPNRQKEKQRLVITVRQMLEKKVSPTIFCQPTVIAQEIIYLLAQHKICPAVSPAIYRINKIYDNSGSRLGKYRLYNPMIKRPSVNIFPLSNDKMSTRYQPCGPTLVIEDRFGENFDQINSSLPPSRRFHLSSTCDTRELKEVIAQVAPKIVLIFGPYTKKYHEELSNCGPKLIPLFPNNQTALF